MAVPVAIVMAWALLSDRAALPLARHLNAWLVGRGWDVPDAHFTAFFLYHLADVMLAGAAFVFGARYCGLSNGTLGWRWPASRLSFVWAAVLVAPVLLAVYAIDLLPDLYLFHRLPSLRWRIDPGWGLWANPTAYHRFFTRALLTPISEELLYRGLLQGALRNRCGGRWAVIGASALFAAMHPYVGTAHLVGEFVCALFFGFLREKSGSVAPPMLAHFTWNQWTSIVQFLPRL